MTAAVITLAIALAGACGALLALVLVGRGLIARVSEAQERERVAQQEQLKQERSMDEAESQRDAALVKATQAQAAADKAIAQLAATQKLYEMAHAELVKRVSAAMVTATPQQAIDEVNRILGGS